MVIFHSYVSLPEGTIPIPLPPQLFMAKKCRKLSHQSVVKHVKTPAAEAPLPRNSFVSWAIML
jgi:hypothetical protein